MLKAAPRTVPMHFHARHPRLAGIPIDEFAFNDADVFLRYLDYYPL